MQKAVYGFCGVQADLKNNFANRRLSSLRRRSMDWHTARYL